MKTVEVSKQKKKKRTEKAPGSPVPRIHPLIARHWRRIKSGIVILSKKKKKSRNSQLDLVIKNTITRPRINRGRTIITHSTTDVCDAKRVLMCTTRSTLYLNTHGDLLCVMINYGVRIILGIKTSCTTSCLNKYEQRL